MFWISRSRSTISARMVAESSPEATALLRFRNSFSSLLLPLFQSPHLTADVANGLCQLLFESSQSIFDHFLAQDFSFEACRATAFLRYLFEYGRCWSMCFVPRSSDSHTEIGRDSFRVQKRESSLHHIRHTSASQKRGRDCRPSCPCGPTHLVGPAPQKPS